jgi:2-polyprenyl-3-methyl-5-hydroxy-6-metoxy-1,4-benzoquinol methylase
VVSRIGFEKRVLEIGCHTGYLSALLAAQGCSVVGIEINGDAAKEAGPYLERLIVGDVEDSAVWVSLSGKFDFVLFLDVLEHLYDPLQSLGRAHGVLQPRGRVLASFPNVACWSIRKAMLRGRFVPPETGLDDPTHIRFFTLDTARQLFTDAGYEILACKALWTSVPLEHRLVRWPWAAQLWRKWWVSHYPGVAIAVPLIEARPAAGE